MLVDYHAIRERMQPGDILACSGRGATSRLIRAVTRSPVSHVAIVTRHKLVVAGEALDGEVVSYMESTSLDGKGGVVEGRVSELVAGYDGRVWWLPLDEATRGRLDVVAFYDWIYRQRGRAYDFEQAVKSGLDVLDRLGIGLATEDLELLFCSELAAAALEKAGAIPAVNASEVTPAELVSWRIYSGAFQLTGSAATLERFNRVEVSGSSSAVAGVA